MEKGTYRFELVLNFLLIAWLSAVCFRPPPVDGPLATSLDKGFSLYRSSLSPPFPHEEVASWLRKGAGTLTTGSETLSDTSPMTSKPQIPVIANLQIPTCHGPLQLPTNVTSTTPRTWGGAFTACMATSASNYALPFIV